MSEQELEVEVEPVPVVEKWAEPRWEGHEHDYPEKPRKNGTKVCRECGYVLDVVTPTGADESGAPIEPEETP